jgi:acyl carrier protein
MQSQTAPVPITIDQVTGAFEEVLRKRRAAVLTITPDTRLESLNLTSVDFAEVCVALQEVVDFEFDPESAVDVETVSDLIWLRPL